MKRALLLLAVALLAGGLVGVLVARDPGYVLVAYQDLALETSLWVALAALVIAYLLLRIVIRLVVRVVSGRGSFRGWRHRRRSRAARDQTVRGLLLMAEGRWEQARKLLEGAADGVEAPLVNYLNAARAAHAAGDAAGRDALLRAADDSTAGAHFAVGLTQAELQRDQGQWEQCLATLLDLHRQSPRHGRVLQMLADCYRRLHDWQAQIELVEPLRKARAMDDRALLDLQIEAWQGRLAEGREDPKALLAACPKELRRERALAIAFADGLAAAGAWNEAEALLRRFLDQSWDATLVRRYGTLTGADAAAMLVVAEGWLKERPNDPDLLLTLGRISLMNRAWARAREYLEASLRLRRTPEAQAELGRLCAALGDAERGSELLSQSLEGLPVLPLPEPDSLNAARS